MRLDAEKISIYGQERELSIMKKSHLFHFMDLDSHYVINLFGIQISLRHKCKFKYKKATTNGISTISRTPKIIISLTSYPERIKTVHLTINTLMQQTLKPDKIILWLSEEEFPNKNQDLPEDLLQLQSLGLTINWCENLKSYKKLVPALIEYPNDIIITVDDDLYFENDTIESLYNSYLKNPEDIHVNRIMRVRTAENDELIPIPSRKHFYLTYKNPSFLNQLMGGSGCLFPPNSLHKDVLNIPKIKSLIPTHDDVYFWVMAVLNGTKTRVVKGFKTHLYYIDGTQCSGLCKINKKNSTGITISKAYRIMQQTYPELVEILKEAQND